MTDKLWQLVYQMSSGLRLQPAREREIVRELESHFEDEIEDLTGTGLSREEAEKAVQANFGLPGPVAGQLNDAYGRGSWGETVAAALPHLFIAALFVLHLWQNFNWRLVGLLSVLLFVVYGWRHDRPTWFFSWLGYLLVPFWIVLVLAIWVIGQALGIFPGDSFAGAWWFWPIIILLLPVLGWVFISVMARTARRDWLLTSLTGLPFPALAVWLTAMFRRGEIQTITEIDSVRDLDLWMALVFVSIAVLVAFFSRVRRRVMKTATLFFACVFTVVLMGQHRGLDLTFSTFTVVLALTLLGLFAAPVLLEHRLGHRGIDRSYIDGVGAKKAYHKS